MKELAFKLSFKVMTGYSFEHLADTVTYSFEATGGREEAAHHSYRKRIRPIRAGYSFGLSRRVGTLGLVVCSKDSPEELLLLSSAHVLNYRFDNKIYRLYQPSGKDRCAKAEVIARAFKYTKLHPYIANYSEAGLAKPLDQGDVDPIHPFGILKGVCEEPYVGQKVHKIGRTTGEVCGKIVATDWSGWVKFGQKKYPFARQIVVENDKIPISLRGDSGSVWIDEQMQVICMNFSGNRSGRYSISTPASRIFSILNIQLPNQTED